MIIRDICFKTPFNVKRCSYCTTYENWYRECQTMEGCAISPSNTSTDLCRYHASFVRKANWKVDHFNPMQVRIVTEENCATKILKMYLQWWAEMEHRQSCYHVAQRNWCSNCPPCEGVCDYVQLSEAITMFKCSCQFACVTPFRLWRHGLENVHFISRLDLEKHKFAVQQHRTLTFLTDQTHKLSALSNDCNLSSSVWLAIALSRTA